MTIFLRKRERNLSHVSRTKTAGIIQTMIATSLKIVTIIQYCMLCCYSHVYRLRSTSWMGAVDIGDDATIVKDKCVLIPNTASNFLPESGPRSLAN